MLWHLFHLCLCLESAETGDLKICRIDKYAGSCNGGEEICILVEKVCKSKSSMCPFYHDDFEVLPIHVL